MILDNENQRTTLLAIINNTQFHGSVVDEVYSIKQAVMAAKVAGVETEPSMITFLPEQQAKVQELIDEAYKKAYAKAQKTFTPDKKTAEMDGGSF